MRSGGVVVDYVRRPIGDPDLRDSYHIVRASPRGSPALDHEVLVPRTWRCVTPIPSAQDDLGLCVCSLFMGVSSDGSAPPTLTVATARRDDPNPRTFIERIAGREAASVGEYREDSSGARATLVGHEIRAVIWLTEVDDAWMLCLGSAAGSAFDSVGGAFRNAALSLRLAAGSGSRRKGLVFRSHAGGGSAWDPHRRLCASGPGASRP